MGFETPGLPGKLLKRFSGVNLPRWGLKRWLTSIVTIYQPSVNLPRWGLKRRKNRCFIDNNIRVNLPRWGLKQDHVDFDLHLILECKFTPLGFETR